MSDGAPGRKATCLCPMIRYLAGLAAAERRRILDVGAEVTALCEPWLDRYPIVRRESVTAACSLVSTVGMPFLAPPELALLTRFWLWIFGVDDRFDDLTVPDAEVATWSVRWAEGLAAEPGEAEPWAAEPGAELDLLLPAFGSLRRDLGRYRLYRPLADAWRDGMHDIVTGMLTERRWHGALTPAELPSYQAYLENGIRTISMRPYTVTACVLADEPRAAAALDTLTPVIYAAARCFRLANDLRSDAREREEGKLNGVWLLQRMLAADGVDDALALAVARDRLRETCEADLRYLYKTQETAPPSIRTLARFLWAHATFVWDMYEVSDYDALSSLLRRGELS